MTTETKDTIKLEPTWEGLLPAMLAVLENGTDHGKHLCRLELRRMAKAADLWNAAKKPKPTFVVEPWGEPNGEGGGWDTVPEADATSWAVIPDDEAQPFEYFETREEAEAYVAEQIA